MNKSDRHERDENISEIDRQIDTTLHFDKKNYSFLIHSSLVISVAGIIIVLNTVHLVSSFDFFLILFLQIIWDSNFFSSFTQIGSLTFYEIIDKYTCEDVISAVGSCVKVGSSKISSDLGFFIPFHQAMTLLGFFIFESDGIKRHSKRVCLVFDN